MSTLGRLEPVNKYITLTSHWTLDTLPKLLSDPKSTVAGNSTPTKYQPESENTNYVGAHFDRHGKIEEKVQPLEMLKGHDLWRMIEGERTRVRCGICAACAEAQFSKICNASAEGSQKKGMGLGSWRKGLCWDARWWITVVSGNLRHSSVARPFFRKNRGADQRRRNCQITQLAFQKCDLFLPPGVCSGRKTKHLLQHMSLRRGVGNAKK